MHFFSAYRNLVGITVTRYLDNNLGHDRWKVGNFKVSPDSDFPFVTVGVDFVYPVRGRLLTTLTRYLQYFACEQKPVRSFHA